MTVDLERAKKVAMCVHIAMEETAAQDVSDTIHGLVREIERLRGEPHPVNPASAADLFAENERLKVEVARCHARLEIDHVFVSKGGGPLERQDVPVDQRLGIPDGIECRDETIKLGDARAERAEAEIERLRAAMDSAKEHAGDATKALLAEVALWKGRTERAEAALATADAVVEAARQYIDAYNRAGANEQIGCANRLGAALIRHDAATGRGG